MLTITAELLHGTIRATSHEDVTITGNTNRAAEELLGAEWPPSPCRVVSALVAADGTRDRTSVTDGRELAVLEAANPPDIFASPTAHVLASKIRERFVVVDGTFIDNKARTTSAVHEYVGRTSAAVRPGARLAPLLASVSYVWADVEADEVTVRALRARAARVGYLGCSDSPVKMTVTLEEAALEWRWQPSPNGSVFLPVPYPGFVQALDLAFDRFLAGEAQRRSWVPNRYARYRPPNELEQPNEAPTVIWIRFEDPINGRKVLSVTETLRAAVLERYTNDIAGGDRERVPAVLTGHGFEGNRYQHAYFLALPDVGHRGARGRIYGGAIVLPAGSDPAIAAAVRSCIWRMRDLVRPSSFQTRVRLFGAEQRPWASHPRRWTGPSRRWASATPVVCERYLRHGVTIDEVARWCENSGIAERPIAFRFAQVPFGEGATSLSPPEVYREGKPRRPFGHLELEFAAPVTGPLVLGRGRQFGLGLMYPVQGGA